MSKNKGFRTVVATVIITLVVLAALSFAAIKYIAPAYQLTQNKIYRIAVTVFPLLVGITLIAIAIVLASDNDEKDEVEDIPNDAGYTELPDKSEEALEQSDDAADIAEGNGSETPFVSVFESYSGSEEEEKEDEPSRESCEQDESHQPIESEEAESSEKEEVVESEPVQEEQHVEDANKPLVDAIMTLVDKMDDFASAVIYGTQEDQDEDAEDEGYEEEDDPIYEDLDRIEAQLEKLTSTITKLSDNLQSHIDEHPVAIVQTAPVAEPQPVEEEREEEKEEVSEPIQVQKAPVEEKVVDDDNSGDMLFRNYEGSEAVQRAKAEYDSAKEFGYDLTIALVQQPVALTALALGEAGDYLDVKGKTLAIIPFASEEEAKEELDKLEVPYTSRTYSVGSEMEYDELTKGLVD